MFSVLIQNSFSSRIYGKRRRISGATLLISIFFYSGLANLTDLHLSQNLVETLPDTIGIQTIHSHNFVRRFVRLYVSVTVCPSAIESLTCPKISFVRLCLSVRIYDFILPLYILYNDFCLTPSVSFLKYKAFFCTVIS